MVELGVKESPHARERRGRNTRKWRFPVSPDSSIRRQVCTSCGSSFPATTEYFYERRQGHLRRDCKECVRDRSAERHVKNRDTILAEWREQRARRRERWKKNRSSNEAQCLYLEWRASHPCLVCGESDSRVIHPHHVNPSARGRKFLNIWKLDEMRAELSKCVPLCANHHILVHHMMRDDIETTEAIRILGGK